MYVQPFPELQKPLKLRGLLLKNRIMSAPNMLFRTLGGRPDEYYVRYLEHKARGGAAIVTLGEANVCDGGNHTPGMETTLENMAVFGEMAQAIHEHGAAASVELTHGGISVKPQFNRDRNRLLSPSGGVGMNGANTRAMTRDDMECVANAYADTAEYFVKCGFDTVLVHCGHGWLLTQFLSPIVNKRTDEYGGSFENRMRFPLYVLQKVRERLGAKRAVLVRVSGSERRPDGFTPENIADFLAKAQEYVDMAEVSSEDFTYTFATPYLPWGQNVELAEAIKATGKVTIPLFTIGSILDPVQAEEILKSGKADGVSMSRALIADPYLPRKAFEGRADEIRPCLRCLNCTDSDNESRHFVCSVNPLIAHEARLGFGDSVQSAKSSKRVLIIGGGPSGLQAAITASERGHSVTLVEKSDKLGGMLNFTDFDTRKTDLRRFKDYLVRQAERSGAEILLNTEADDALIERVKPDSIIIAAGSNPIVPTYIKGFERAKHAAAVYFEPELEIAGSVVIIGGGLIGVETGLHLASLGKKVTVLEMSDTYAPDAKGVYKLGIERAAETYGLTIITGAKATEINDSGVICKSDGGSHPIPGGSVFYAVGMSADDSLYLKYASKAPQVVIAGDCKRVGKVGGAIQDGFFAALDVL
ncbi:MAG: FAD-dependent oxidoreductase [Oscillospiraceae bacterium]|jgi:2,4-dienoyl-CoA reductase-like NADH-dependent reductase (Old Yellow Enzyme family)/thioredoxin reductase|nr:FAD-dependent oxidoreductase [Oscillospiraceae bacterium]